MATEFTEEQIETMARVFARAVSVYPDHFTPGRDQVVGNGDGRRYGPDTVTVEQALELLGVIDQRKLEREQLSDLIAAYREKPSLEMMQRIVRKASIRGHYDYGRKDADVGRAVQAALAPPAEEGPEQ